MPAPPPSHRTALALVFAACATYPVDTPSPPPAQSAAAPRPTLEPTRILSAHAQPVGSGERDYFGVPVGGLLYLVFSRPLDPASLAPGRFVTLADDGTRRVPIAARLAPASERDELRALELVLPAPERKILSVTVIGQFFDIEGHDLEGLAADVAATNTPPFPASVERLPGDIPECPGLQVVRVWWSVPVYPGLQPARLLARQGGVHPVARLGDVSCRPPAPLQGEGAAPCDAADDNVLDLCFPPGDEVALELPADAARDRQGIASAAARFDLPAAP